MAQVTKKQLTSFDQVEKGDKIICMASYGYDHLLTEGLSYEVISSEPNLFNSYGTDYVTIVSNKPEIKVTAHITRFSKA